MSLGDLLFFCGEMAGVGSGSKGEERSGIGRSLGRGSYSCNVL